MKIKNIAFSGFAAAILAIGAAGAATTDVPQIASKDYVDSKVNTDIAALATSIENNYTTNDDLDGVITSNITAEMNGETGVIGQALADKENSDNKVNAIDENNQNSETQFPTIGAVTSYTQQAIKDVVDAGIADDSVTTPKIADGNVTADKLSEELNTKIDAAQTAEDVAKAIANAVSDEQGDIQKALADKLDAEQVNAAIEDYTIPVPEPDCKARSGSCVLSVDTAGKLTWVNVTATTGTEAE